MEFAREVIWRDFQKDPLSLPSFCDCIYFETELPEGEVVGQTRLSLKACDNLHGCLCF